MKAKKYLDEYKSSKIGLKDGDLVGDHYEIGKNLKLIMQKR